jgi:hypothetical protein
VVNLKVLSSAPAKKDASAKSTNYFAILNVTHQAHAITNRRLSGFKIVSALDK